MRLCRGWGYEGGWFYSSGLVWLWEWVSAERVVSGVERARVAWILMY